MIDLNQNGQRLLRIKTTVNSVRNEYTQYTKFLTKRNIIKKTITQDSEFPRHRLSYNIHKKNTIYVNNSRGEKRVSNFAKGISPKANDVDNYDIVDRYVSRYTTRNPSMFTKYRIKIMKSFKMATFLSLTVKKRNLLVILNEHFGEFIYQLKTKIKTLVRKLERHLIKLYRQHV